VKPNLYIIAGPNGAGKTTFAGKFLPRYTQSCEFVNADEIAQRLCPTSPESVAFQAGREMLRRIDALAEQRVDFSIETTLSGKSYVPWLRRLRNSGYAVHLYFLWLPEVLMSIERVADRVRKGGHNIPEPVIRRRYSAGIKNLFQAYRPLLVSWTLFDNSNPLLYTIASEKDGRLNVLDRTLFSRFMAHSEPESQELKERGEAPEWEKAVVAMRLAMIDVVNEHLRTGHPLITWRNGRIYRQPPEEAKRELEAALKSDPWASLQSK
jgi:predicted ABC-type ATPase